MKKIFAFIKRLFSKAAKLVQKFVQPSIAVTEALKNAVNSPVTPILTALIPGHLDDKIVTALKTQLPKVLQVLHIADECSKHTDPDEIIRCAVNALRKYNPDGQAATYHSIASLLSVYLSDGKLTWKEAVHLAQAAYNKNI